MLRRALELVSAALLQPVQRAAAVPEQRYPAAPFPCTCAGCVAPPSGLRDALHVGLELLNDAGAAMHCKCSAALITAHRTPPPALLVQEA